MLFLLSIRLWLPADNSTGQLFTSEINKVNGLLKVKADHSAYTKQVFSRGNQRKPASAL